MGKRGGRSGTWAKVKVDQQIIAIAKVSGAERIYTADPGVVNLAKKVGLVAVMLWELPLPPVDAQGDLLAPLET